MVTDNQIEQVKSVVGPSWALMLGDLFYSDTCKELEESISRRKSNPWSDFESTGDYFDFLKKTPEEDLCAVYVTDVPKFSRQILDEIECDLFDCLNLGLTSHTNYDWLREQGIMIFPRCLSWGTDGHHREWLTLTDDILIRILNNKPDTVVALNKSSRSLEKDLLGCTVVGQGPGCWERIDQHVRKKFVKKIDWTP